MKASLHLPLNVQKRVRVVFFFSKGRVWGIDIPGHEDTNSLRGLPERPPIRPRGTHRGTRHEITKAKLNSHTWEQ
jgi:hypothetical protein